jgi:hypothetical protein
MPEFHDPFEVRKVPTRFTYIKHRVKTHINGTWWKIPEINVKPWLEPLLSGKYTGKQHNKLHCY